MPTEPKVDPVRVLVITVSYRTAELVIRSLHALRNERELARAEGIELCAVVVDNASGDSEALRRAVWDNAWSQWVTVITAERNGGFAYGNNVGFRHAYATGRPPDHFYLLNPDAVVRPHAVGEFVRFMEAHPRVGTAGSSLTDGDGQLWPYAFRFPSLVSEVDSGLALGLFTRLVKHRIVLRRMGDTPEEVDWYPGASMIIRREVIDQLGGMDESYFLYYEETDFCLKVRRAGWSSFYVPSACAEHLSGQSTGVTGAEADTRRLPKYWFESRRRYFAKNFGTRRAMAIDAAFLTAHLLGELKRRLQGKAAGHPHFVADFFENSVLRRRNRELAPAREYLPAQPAR